MQIQGSSKVRSDINVTPLVDVCLVLLIIFMVVTPLLGKEDGVALPKTADPERVSETGQISIAVRGDASIWLEQRPVTESELREVLADLHLADPERRVVVKADGRLAYGQVLGVLGIVRELKFDRAALITDRDCAD